MLNKKIFLLSVSSPRDGSLIANLLVLVWWPLEKHKILCKIKQKQRLLIFKF